MRGTYLDAIDVVTVKRSKGEQTAFNGALQYFMQAKCLTMIAFQAG